MVRTRLLPALTLAVGLGAGTLFGSTLVSHASAAVLAACGLPAHHAAPVVKPKPRPAHQTTTVLVDVGGSDNKQTDTFRVSGVFGIAWQAHYADKSLGFGTFSVELDDAQGNPLDLVSNTAKETDDSSTEHADCSHGCYFKISATNMTWRLVAVR